MNATAMKMVPGLYGLVMCGGNSSRMGTDKSMLQYHTLPQRYHLYTMLEPFCEKVLISCNESQAPGILPGYDCLTDKPVYRDIGPMAGLLTAFNQYPEKDFLLIGCDYPLFKKEELEIFITQIEQGKLMAYYKEADNVYEPLLAYYPSGIFQSLIEQYENNQFALQQLLKDNQAKKYLAADAGSIVSIDSYEQYIQTKAAIKEMAIS